MRFSSVCKNCSPCRITSYNVCYTKLLRAKKLLDEYETNFTQSKERWEHYKELASSPEEKNFIELHDRARSDWEKSSREILNEVARGTETSEAQAMASSLGETSDKFEQMRDQINGLTELSLNNAQRANDQAP